MDAPRIAILVSLDPIIHKNFVDKMHEIHEKSLIKSMILDEQPSTTFEIGRERGRGKKGREGRGLKLEWFANFVNQKLLL